MKRSRIIATLAFGLTLSLSLATPASAYVWVVNPADNPIYTYHDAPSRSNVQYSEGAIAPSFYRKGVAAQVAKADGPTWQTTVWLGTVSTSGTNITRLKDSELGSKRTWGKFVFLPNPNDPGKLEFGIWLLNVAMARDTPPETPSTETTPDASATSEPVIPGFGAVSENVPDAVVSTSEYLGNFEGLDAWRADDAQGSVHLLVSDGSFLAQTQATADGFDSYGVPIRIGTPSGDFQLVLLPDEELDTTGLAAVGFSEVSHDLYATASPAESYSTVQLTNESARGRSVTVPLFIPVEP